MDNGMDKLVQNILRDVRVELSDEFDRNFSRQGFFGEKWQRRKTPSARGDRAVLTDTGALRRGISSRISGNTITFYSDLPYAGIHNDGGEIRVMARMKRFFWAKYRETCGSFGYRKNGLRRQDKRNLQLTAEAEFWRSMALKKVVSVIRMPRRQFLGTHPKLEQAVRSIIEENLEKALGDLVISEK